MTPHALVLATVLLHVQPWSGDVSKACREIERVTGGEAKCSEERGFLVRFEESHEVTPGNLADAWLGPYECRVVYRPGVKLTEWVLTHELGHCIGFPDSNDPRDLMWPHEKRLRWPWSRARFTDREREAWRVRRLP